MRTWFDSRYISIADHRQDIRDALWEVQTLRREVAALQGEVERLRNARPAQPRADDACRLARETAKSLDGVLQNEVLVWQAIDGLRDDLRDGPRARRGERAGQAGSEARPCG